MNPSAPLAHSRQVAERTGPKRAGDLARCPLTRRQLIEGFEPIVLAPAYFGPPAIFLLGPWLLLVLLLMGPAALLITFVLLFVVAAAALAAVVALLASPYLLVRHLRTRHYGAKRPFTFVRRSAGTAPAADERAPQAPSGAPLAA